MTKLMGMLIPMLALAVGASLMPLAAAQYMGNVGEQGQTGQNTLEETLKLARDRVEYAQNYKCEGCATDAGNALLTGVGEAVDPTGVMGATIVTGAVFGGIALAFMWKGRQGKFAKDTQVGA